MFGKRTGTGETVRGDEGADEHASADHQNLVRYGPHGVRHLVGGRERVHDVAEDEHHQRLPEARGARANGACNIPALKHALQRRVRAGLGGMRT